MLSKTERSFYLGVIAVLAVIVFLLRSCGQAKCNCPEIPDFQPIEVTAIDTVFITVKDSTQWHKPAENKNSKEAQKSPVLKGVDSMHQPKEKEAMIEPGMAQMRFYSDTNQIAGGGSVIVQAVGNIDSLRVLTDLKQLTVEKTITRTLIVAEKPKGHLFAGIIAQGMKTDFLTGFGAELMYETKKRKVWKVATLYGKGGQLIFQAGTLFNIF
jgi:hypothetical protein